MRSMSKLFAIGHALLTQLLCARDVDAEVAGNGGYTLWQILVEMESHQGQLGNGSGRRSSGSISKLRRT